MQVKDERMLVIAMNWLIFITILLCGWPLLMMGIGAAYHPNAPLSPYVNSTLYIWPIALLLTLFLCIVTSTIAKRSAPRKTTKLSAFAYLCLIGLYGVILLATKPVPAYFLQSINDGATRYKVPSEYVWGGRDNGNSLQFWMCMNDLKGKYARRRVGCTSREVSLSTSLPASSFAKSIHPYFFESHPEFGLDEDRVVLEAGSERYLVPLSFALKSYSIQTPWSASDLQNTEKDSFMEIPTYLQLKEQNEIVRFILCRQSNHSERASCKHVTATNQGVLTFETEGVTEFNPAGWERQENDILDLISQWKI